MFCLNRVLFSLVAAAVFGSTAPTVHAQTQSKAEEVQDVDVDLGLRIPMRDGVILGGSLYRPHGQTKGRPVIMNLSPYLADRRSDDAIYLASRGFVVACVNVRGRGDSAGTFDTLVHDSEDGADIVEWLARQSFCDGHVGMMGGSYDGYTQWATAKQLPRHLSTIIPTAAIFPGVDFPGLLPIYMPYEVRWNALVSGAGINMKLFANDSFWAGKFRKAYQEHVPFEALESVLGFSSPLLHKLLQHPTQDAYWDALSPSPEQYKGICHPILTITGHFDDDQTGALTYYRSHMQYGSDLGKKDHYLVIGPWDHAGTWQPQAEVGGLKIGAAGVIDTKDLRLDWFRWTMDGGPKPPFLKGRVAYYVMGRDEWKYADSLEAMANGKFNLFLGSQGRADDVYHSGTLQEQVTPGAALDGWTYDPLRTEHGLAMPPMDGPDYLVSQFKAMNLDGEGLIYHTEPLKEPVEITGIPRLTLWLTMDVPDTDVFVDLDEVTKDGASIQLSTAFMRARYRESLRQEKLVPAGVPLKYTLDNWTFFSRQVAKGSRLRLVISSLNDPAWQHNMQGGGVVAKETAKDARTARIKLLHEPGHESVLELPIVK